MSRQDARWNEFYERAWAKRDELVQSILSSGTQDPFAAIQKVYRHEQTYLMKNYQDKGVTQFEPRNYPPVGGSFPTGKPFYRHIPIEESVALVPFYNNHVDFLLDYIEGKSFEAIIELGSGYGQNLIELYYRGGPQNIPYYAGEFTKSGTDLAKKLAALKSDWNLIPFRFDYKNPDLSIVKEKKNILIFTSHSIEQVSEIGKELFKHLSSHAENVTCIHFEPFGFQLEFPDKKYGKISEDQASYFEKNDWNMNLGPLLIECHQEKEINLTFIAKNVMGTNVLNATSIAIWENQKSKTPS